MIIIQNSSGCNAFQQWVDMTHENELSIVPKKKEYPFWDNCVWGQASLQKSVERRSKMSSTDLPPKPEPGCHQSLAQCLWRLRETTTDALDFEPLPIYFVKDGTHVDERLFYRPNDYQIITEKTAMNNHHNKCTEEAFRQIHSSISLLSRTVCGNQQESIQPCFIQVPRTAFRKDTPRHTSERITILIEVPNFSVKISPQVKEFTKGVHKGVEFLEFTIATDTPFPLSEAYLWTSWEHVMLQTPSLIQTIQEGKTSIPRVLPSRTKQTARKAFKAKMTAKAVLMKNRRRSPRGHTKEELKK